MLASELITQVRAELLEPVPGFWSDVELLNSINRGEADYVQRVRGLDAVSQVHTIAGTRNYPLPLNFLSSILLEYKIDETNDTWTRVKPTSIQRLAQEDSNFLTGNVNARTDPSEYFIFNKELWLTPTPAETGRTLRLFYKRRAIALTATTSSLNVPDELSDAIRNYVLWKAWSKAKEMDLADEQKQLYFEAIGQGRRWSKKQVGDLVHRIDMETPQAWSDPAAE